ncbi:ABC transporter, ATP-binding protein [Alteracholeplasma palmae J233]|uniref:ABC transporter, ATP-binding protein n=1 Tax=Alteracholeplasma palmae (strain ATCC 49389 / J233) TaxID=1318466 RepID=U4KK36_ALTPJ|nr:ABC transporter ATP-binding protein [Alteracholeplasma palmae]CCV63989.1 ABC transporter, ATP-binding protein [Alteracholeplasma palmae J233]
MLRVLKEVKLRDWITILVSIGFITLQVWLELTIPDYMNNIIKEINKGQGNGSIGSIWQNGGLMLALTLASLLASVVTGYIAARVAANVSMNIRGAVFNKVESFSMDEISKFSTPSLITRTTNDVTQVQMLFTMGLQVFFKAPITAIWAISKIYGKNYASLTILVGSIIAFLIVFVLVIVLAVLPKFKKVQALTDNLNNVTRENLTGLRVVRAYNAEDYEEEKFNQANDKLMKNYLFTNTFLSFINPVLIVAINFLSLGIYYLGAHIINGMPGETIGDFVGRGNTLADIMVFMSYAMQVVMSFLMLVMILFILPRAIVSSKRIKEILDTDNKIKDGGLTALDGKDLGTVEFRNVSFKYPDAEEYVLENINFKANRGDTIAFIGSTGSGKSTLINLIPRFYDITEGEVLVNGNDVRDYKVNELRNMLGYVPQKGVLFSGSVKENINFGENGFIGNVDEQLDKALEIAQAKSFVDKMDDKVDSHIAQGGKNVSGGQKQRLSIARAVYKNPLIYIFDDSFSALDYKTDKILRKELSLKTDHATSLIVAQRIGTIKNANQIIVLEEGKVVGQGTHNELMKTCEVYQEIAYSQLSKEELSND